MTDHDDEQDGGAQPAATGGSVLDAILAGASASSNRGMFSPDSRYANVGITTIDVPIPGTSERRTLVYLRRRFLPDPKRFAVLRTHTVTDGERLDHIAARELGDPLAFWKICDANRLMQPLDLPAGSVGKRWCVPLPEGVPAPSGRD